MRRTMAAVIGSGSDPHTALSEPLGRWLAEKGFDLVNGGGAGVMDAVAKAFSEVKSRKGRVVGILPSSAPCKTERARAGLHAEVTRAAFLEVSPGEHTGLEDAEFVAESS